MDNKTILLCVAWLAILVVVLGVAGPALVSAKNTMAVITGCALVMAGAVGLWRLGIVIYTIFTKEN